jgi:hypothetical protein
MTPLTCRRAVLQQILTPTIITTFFFFCDTPIEIDDFFSPHLVKILVIILLANELANIGYKNKLEFIVGHWHAKKLAAIQTHTNFLVIANKLVSYSSVTI